MAKKIVKKATKKEAVATEPKLLKLNLGCGKSKMEGFTGIDVRKFEGSDAVEVECDLGTEKWPFKDASVDEAHCSHMIEHLTADQRVHFVNELDRVLKPGAKCLLIAPHWSSCRAYGDMTHVWPPVSEFWFYYLSKAWREANAPHNDKYTCDLAVTWGFNLHPEIQAKNEESKRYALQFYKEAAQDIIATISKQALIEQPDPVVLSKPKKKAKKKAKK
jgi:ubiquinone/menaquinone biosynthesis C-methylase UbiE